MSNLTPLKKVVTLLRDPTLNKTEGQLKSVDGAYCVLGVICEAYRQQHPRTSAWLVKNYSDTPVVFIAFDEYVSSFRLPLPVKKWIGFKSGEGELENSKYESLSAMNDRTYITLPEFANFIETRPEGLFA